MLLPNYKHSSLNGINSILKYYGVETTHLTLPILDQILVKKYRTIIYLIFDGLGNQWLEENAKDSFLLKNRIDILSTVFPSTTTAAMNTYYSAMSPIAHGWLGWTGYFKEYTCYIDLFTGYDSDKKSFATHEYLELIKYDDIFSQIKAKSPVKLYSVFPSFLKARFESEQVKIENEQELLDQIIRLSKVEEEKFVLAYYHRPDDLMHEYGPSSKIVREYVELLDQKIKLMADQLADDTLIIISADHGQIDVEREYFIADYPQIANLLVRRPCLESRAASFFVKENCHEEFIRLFNQQFESDFKLFTRQEVLDFELYGPGVAHPKSLDFLGDFLAVGIGNALLHYKKNEDWMDFKGHHAGLKEEEMLVPLIVIKKDK